MKYIATFNTVFFILALLQILQLLVSYAAASSKNHNISDLGKKVFNGWVINIGWLILLSVTGYYDLPAVTTFLFVIFCVGIPLGIYLAHRQSTYYKNMVEPKVKDWL